MQLNVYNGIDGITHALLPGDSLTLPDGSVLVYLTGKQAQAYTLLCEDHQQCVRDAIKHAQEARRRR